MATPLFTMKRGDTFKLTFRYQNSGGSAIDLTGCTARLQIRAKRTGTLLLEAATASGVTVYGPTGTIALLVTPDKTRTLPIGTHEFDLELTYPDGTVSSTETSLVKVIEDITRD